MSRNCAVCAQPMQLSDPRYSQLYCAACARGETVEHCVRHPDLMLSPETHDLEHVRERLGVATREEALAWWSTQRALATAEKLSSMSGECAELDECADCFTEGALRVSVGDAGFVHPGLWLCNSHAVTRAVEQCLGLPLDPFGDPLEARRLLREQYERQRAANTGPRTALANPLDELIRIAQGAQEEAWRKTEEAIQAAQQAAEEAREERVIQLAAKKADRIAMLATTIRAEYKLPPDLALALAKETLREAEQEIPPLGGRQYEGVLSGGHVIIREKATTAPNFPSGAPQHNGGPAPSALSAHYGATILNPES